MRRRALLALLMLLPLAPLGAAAVDDASDGLAVDAEIVLLPGGERAQLVVTMREGAQHFSPWRLLVPRDMTFVEAYDAAGPLAAEQDDERQVVVDARGRGASYAFRAIFEGPVVRDGPWTRLVADVTAPPGAATSARVVVPDGWRVDGWRTDDGTPDATGIARAHGPMHVEYLAIAADAPTPTPDPRVAGASSLRESVARVALDGVTVETRVTYDTDVLSPDWSLLLPEGATFLGASSPYGALDADLVDGRIVMRAPYPFGFHLGAQPVDLAWRLPAPESYGGAFHRAHIGIPAASDDVLRLTVELDEGMTLTGAHSTSATREAPRTFASNGTMSVALAFLPPPTAGEARFETGAFVVSAPARVEAEARRVAEEATQALSGAATFLGGAHVDAPFHVAYTDAEVFDWEAGFYSDGLNTISIRASQLDAIAAGEENTLRATQTLLHEVAHGLVDRLFPHAGERPSFLEEGLARLVETRVELLREDDAVVCTTEGLRQSCAVRSARPSHDHVDAFYGSGATLDPAWDTATTADDARALHYDLSGMVFHHYERRAPPGALPAALAALAAEDGAVEDAEAVVEALLARAPDLTRGELLAPGRALHGAPQFRACMGPLLAPPMPWEDVGEARGCGSLDLDNGNESMAPSLAGPAPPAPYALVGPVGPHPDAAAVWSWSPPARVPLPTAGAPADAPDGGAADVEPFAPGGVPAATPGAPLAALVLAALVVALALRRRV